MACRTRGNFANITGHLVSAMIENVGGLFLANKAELLSFRNALRPLARHSQRSVQTLAHYVRMLSTWSARWINVLY